MRKLMKPTNTRTINKMGANIISSEQKLELEEYQQRKAKQPPRFNSKNKTKAKFGK